MGRSPGVSKMAEGRRDEGDNQELAGLRARVAELERELMSRAVSKEIESTRDRAAFFELVLDMLCIARVDGYFIDLSPAWTRTLGYSVEELCAEPFIHFVHPDDRRVTLQELSRLGEGQHVIHFTNRYRRRDGSYASIEWSAMPVVERGLIYAAARDVTVRDQTEAALRSAHGQLRHVLSASHVVLYASSVAPNSATTFVSDNVEEQFGYAPREFIADTNFWSERVHPEDRAHVDAELSQLAEASWRSYEYRWRRKDGSYRWVQDDCRLVRDEEGAPVEVLGVMQDITERKAAQETIRQQALSLLELSTPLIPISDDVLVMPLIGVVDARRADRMLETLLHGISSRRARAAILDITGVGAVDTLVAAMLVRAARAAQLLGARVLLTGIRADVAQTLVGLGVDLGGIVTCGTLQDGIRVAMQAGRRSP